MTSRFFNRVMPSKKGGFEVSPTPAINRNSVDTTPTGGTNPSNGYSRGTPQRRSTVTHQPPSATSPRTGTIRQEMKAAASPNPVKRFQVQGNTGPYPETRTEVPGSTDPHQTPVETRYEVPAPHPTTSELVSDAIHFAQNSKNTTPKRLPPTPIQTPTQYEELDRIGNYQLIKTIGKGNFAKVKLAKHIPTGQQVAIKMIDKTQLSESDLKKLYREVRIMKRLNHPNIVKLYEILEDDRYLHLVLEYASKGEIFDYVVSRGRLQEADARKKFRQIISAIHYCHRNNIVHRDLKAENLLLDEDMNLKIADFGFSNEFTCGHKLNTFCGSPPYAAPELFQGKKYDGPEVDVWSLGVILYTMVSGSLPFDGRTIKDLKERIVKGRYQIPFFMTAECEQMLRKFLVINPARRTTLENAMQEKWINLGYEGRELRPYEETTSALNEDCIDAMVEMGYNREDIRQSLDMLRYDHLYATYHLLVTKSSPVRGTVSRASMGQSLQRTPLRRSIQNGDVIHTTPSQPSAAPTGGPSSAPVPPPRTRRLKPGVDNNTIKNNKPGGASVRRTPSNVERPSNDVIYATPSNNNTNGYVNGKHEPDLKLIQTTYSRPTANNQRRMRSPSSDSQNRMSIRQTGNNAAVLNQYRMRSPSSDSQNRMSTRQSVVQTNPRGSQRYDSRPGNTATLPSSNPRQLPMSGAQRGVEYITNPQNSRISAHRRNPSVDSQRPINSSVPKRSTTPSNLVSTSIVTDPRQGRNRDVRTGLSSRAASQTIPSAINTSTNHIFSDFDSVSMSRQGSIRSTCSISVTPPKFIRQNPARQTVDGRSTAVSPNIIYLPPDKAGKAEMKSRSRFPFFDRFKFSNKR